MRLPISEIKVGERRREDMGDLQSLTDSIQQFGLLHPIVVDDKMRLVAGGRRLAACKFLGWQTIEAMNIGELSDAALREIELEENLKRKDLTEYEKSRNMVELAEIKAQKEGAIEFRSERDQKSKGRGRPSKPDSIEKVAKAIGASKTTLIEAQQHVTAVEKYPELKYASKETAIEAAKRLDALPPEERENLLKPVREQLDKSSEEYKRDVALIEKDHRIWKVFNRAINDAALLQVNEENIASWIREMPRSEVEYSLGLARDGIKKLQAVEKHLKKVLAGPRLAAVNEGGKN